MAGQRKRYSAEIKAKVALEAIKGQKTANEIASAYGVHPSQITQWKKQALEELPNIFSSRQLKKDSLCQAFGDQIWKQRKTEKLGGEQ